ncbi:MAG: nuclease [candidate division Zixibacteria bacterium]|nr:nuclease [candidate division Zixibacteria bacterium]
MGFILIKGTFHVVGYSPDGDSLKLKASKLSHWKKLAGPKVKLNKRNCAQLRFEAVDALETHYQSSHQPKELADAATDYVLKEAGITNVQWGATHGRVVSANDGVPGYILSRTTERYQRPVAFVFAGTTNKTDGKEYFLDKQWLKQSLNYKLLKAGHVFATYYKGLFPDLREVMTDAAIEAWNKNKGIWPYDWTNYGVPVSSLKSVEEEYVVMPKLFRRIYDYLKKHGSIKGFKKYLEKKEENILVLTTGHFTHFDTVIKEQGNKITLTEYPENLIFLD